MKTFFCRLWALAFIGACFGMAFPVHLSTRGVPLDAAFFCKGYSL